MESSVSQIQTSASAQRGGAGRPPLLQRDPTLAGRVVKLLDAGRSMQLVAHELKIGIRTLRDWARTGERLESGPLRDIALAVARSKNKRGFGDQKQGESPSPRTESEPGARVVAVVGSEEEWREVGYDFSDRNPFPLEKIRFESIKHLVENGRYRGSKPKAVNPEPPESKPELQSTDSPRAGRYEVLRAAELGGHGWQDLSFTSEQFEALYEVCEKVRRAAADFVPPEEAWPRDYRALTPEQKQIVDKRAQCLVRASSGEMFRVRFRWA